MQSKLARSMSLTIRGTPINVRTPLLIPSFSSKAGHDIDVLFDALERSITESFLISAYDLSHNKIHLPTSALAEAVFLDSGGYEASKDFNLMNPSYPSMDPNPWTIGQYRAVLETIDPIMPMFVTAFDHPSVRQPIALQIDTALEIFKDFTSFGREILIKPEEMNEQFVSIPRLIAHVKRFSEFDVIGITEVELGGSILERMANIARLRLAMDAARIEKPLHIFGSLDPVCTPLYFLAGADIFDGLTWIRFAYWEDKAVYHNTYAPLQLGITDRDELNLIRTHDANLRYLSEIKRRLLRYLLEGDKAHLGSMGDFFVRSVEDLRAEVKGV